MQVVFAVIIRVGMIVWADIAARPVDAPDNAIVAQSLTHDVTPEPGPISGNISVRVPMDGMTRVM